MTGVASCVRLSHHREPVGIIGDAARHLATVRMEAAMGGEACGKSDDSISAAVEAVKARIVAALDAMPVNEVRQLIREIEDETGKPPKC